MAEATTNRCQAVGGARPWNRTWREAESPASTPVCGHVWARTCGDSNAGEPAGISVPANWISEQIAQKSWASPLGFCFEGTAGASGGVEGCDCEKPISGKPNAVDLKPFRCTCPKDNTSWTASANSAMREPARMFDRNQRIT